MLSSSSGWSPHAAGWSQSAARGSTESDADALRLGRGRAEGAAVELAGAAVAPGGAAAGETACSATGITVISGASERIVVGPAVERLTLRLRLVPMP
jgi:hypothetical protein